MPRSMASGSSCFMSPLPEPRRTISFSRSITSNWWPSPDEAGHDQVERVGADVDGGERVAGRLGASARLGRRRRRRHRASLPSGGRSGRRTRSAQAGGALDAAGGGAPRRRRSGAPGLRVVRSIGPDTLTAATTRPVAVAHRRAHRRHAGLALAHALRPSPRRPSSPVASSDSSLPGRAQVERAATRPAARSCAGRGATRGRRRTPGGRRRARRAARSRRWRRAARSSAPAAAVGQRDGLGRGPAERDQAHAEGEAPVVVAPHQAVGLERDGQPVGGGPGEPGGLDQLGQRQRAGLAAASRTATALSSTPTPLTLGSTRRD